MEDRSDSATDSDRSCSFVRSGSRVIGEKWGGEELGEEEVANKRVKMRNLESVFRSEGLSNTWDFKPERSEKKHNGSLDSNTEFIVGLDLNVKDLSSSANQAPSHSVKNRCQVRSSDVSECGSTEDSDPLKRWMEMKQNGFLSSSYGGIPAPKPRARKPKTDAITRKMEIAKREQVDRFTKIAAPSGLLNELNPGIINRVRNRKQVHSIIESLVRSEKRENHLKSRGNENGNWHEGTNRVSMPSEDYATTPKFSLSTVNAYSFSNDESGDLSAISSLSLKAATVASQWLELLHQDVKGRLAALRRSKKKVRAVINTELPFLLSKQVLSDQENDFYEPKHFSEGFSVDANAETHRARWTALFGQMDHSLSEEEKQLESWLSQVKEMQIHCDQGLVDDLRKGHGLRELGAIQNGFGQGKAGGSGRELAVLAAAASIYSTCNLLTISKENVSCF